MWDERVRMHMFEKELASLSGSEGGGSGGGKDSAPSIVPSIELVLLRTTAICPDPDLHTLSPSHISVHLK